MSETPGSEENPVQVSWTETALWPGRLGLTTAPGWRAGLPPALPVLEADLSRLRREMAAQVLVSLLESGEGGLPPASEAAEPWASTC